MEGLTPRIPERRRSAAAEARAADFDFAREMSQPSSNQERVAAIDAQIAMLVLRKQKGRESIANMTNPRIIELAGQQEDAIDAQIAELERQKNELEGGSSVN